MPVAANRTEAPIAIRVDLAAIFVSLELSRSKWLITSLSPGAGEKVEPVRRQRRGRPSLGGTGFVASKRSAQWARSLHLAQ